MNENDSDSESNSDRKIWMAKPVQKEMQKVPEAVRDQFLLNLEMARMGLQPTMLHEKLKTAGNGVIELKINGSPAYRCMHVVEKNGDVTVLHVTSKTAQGQDKQLIKTTSQRYKRRVQPK